MKEKMWHWLLMALTHITLIHDNYSPFLEIIYCQNFPHSTHQEKKASLDGTHVFWNALPLKVFFPLPYEKHFNSSWLENITFQRNSSHFVFFFQMSLIAYLHLNIYPTVLFRWPSVPFWDVLKYGPFLFEKSMEIMLIFFQTTLFIIWRVNISLYLSLN